MGQLGRLPIKAALLACRPAVIPCSPSSSFYSNSWGCSSDQPSFSGRLGAEQTRSMVSWTQFEFAVLWKRAKQKVSHLLSWDKLMHPDLYDATLAQMCQKMDSSGVVMKPYVLNRSVASWNPFDNDDEGWEEGEKRLSRFWGRAYGRLVCHQSIKGYRARRLKERVYDAYRNINAALAEGSDMKVVTAFATSIMLDQLNADVRTRQLANWHRVDWRIAGVMTHKDIELLQCVVVPGPQPRMQLKYVQWTVKIKSKQVFAAYTKPETTSTRNAHKQLLSRRLKTAPTFAPVEELQLVAGDPNKEVEVEDYWVFERPILKSAIIPKPGPTGANWRLMARLDPKPVRVKPQPEYDEHKVF